ncbi:rhamnogalacturonan lyase [Nocardiopsis oceani]
MAVAGVSAITLVACGAGGGGPAAQNGGDPAADAAPAVQLENLDRGLVAVDTDEGVFLSWRLLGDEAEGHADAGLEGPGFEVHRDGEHIATVEDSTNYVDEDSSGESEYTVVPVKGDGPEGQASPWGDGHYDLPLDKPEGGTTPAGEDYEYTAHDVSVGDVTGDGQYEFVVKWDPTNSKDNSHVGYTGSTIIDTYTLDGELLNRIDLGVNIRAGNHYTQFLVYDFDGDGRAEIMMKTAPGTTSTSYEDGEPGKEELITMPEEDLEVGYSHEDDYRLSAEDYYEHVVEMFETWHEHPEVEDGNWPETLEEAFGEEPQHDYPLSREDAEELADLFFDEYALERDENNAQLREFEGFIIDGPEYLTVFDGETGAELDTVHYEPERGDDGLLWGDYALERIEPGNRVDRFLAGVAYLDGQAPSAVFSRGQYTRSVVATYDFDGESIQERWTVDSGHVPMENPFNARPHQGQGNDPDFGEFAGQGFHQLSVADVDGDGKQEIVYGGATLDHDGSLLYSSTGIGHEDSDIPGEEMKLGHGDALFVGYFDPNREGKEIFTIHEDGPFAPYAYVMRDAETGETLWGGYTPEDPERGMVGDIDPDTPGYHAWTSISEEGPDPTGLFTVEGEYLGEDTPGTNMSIRWAADMTTQLLEGAGTETPAIEDWQNGTLLEAEGTLTNNEGGDPSLVADVFGDWREELILRTEDSEALRIYTSTEVTDRNLYTLVHDPQYRVEVARQQTGYKMPPLMDFYFGSDIDWSQVPLREMEFPVTD